MAETNTAYLEARETMKRVLQMPEAERKTVLDMMRGAIAISDMYSLTAPPPPAEAASSGGLGAEATNKRAPGIYRRIACHYILFV